MRNRIKWASIVFLALLLFVSLIFLCWIWVPIWIVTGWSYLNVVQDYFERYNLT